jgi:hypothetical protein
LDGPFTPLSSFSLFVRDQVINSPRKNMIWRYDH